MYQPTYGRHATDIAAYTFQAEQLCPACTLGAIPRARELFNADPQLDAEGALRLVAEELAIDYDDLYSYDTDDFPKVVFVSQLDGIETDDGEWQADRCDHCGEEL